jgi:hypothetical protein
MSMTHREKKMTDKYPTSRHWYEYTQDEIEDLKEFAKKDGGFLKFARMTGRRLRNVREKANRMGIYEPSSMARKKRRADIKAGLIKAKP